MTPLHDLPDRIVLALTIWGESRGEPVEGQIAVACVVRNRLTRAINTAPRWRDICLAPMQFSCFNEADPNAGPIARAAVNLMTALPTPELAQALWISDGILAGAVIDNVLGATHYVTEALMKSHPPKWAVGEKPLCQIGAHVFFRVP